MVKTLVYTNNKIGNHVKCKHCGVSLLVNIGENKCPQCGANGQFQ